MSKVVTVFGATGKQGGSVVKYLSGSSANFQIRAVTRNASAEKATSLKQQYNNVEIVEADTNNKEQVKRVVQGSYAVFAVTNFWDPEVLQDNKKEIQQGKNIVDAAVESNVGYLIYSSLPNCMGESSGKLPVPHFSNKNEVERYAKTFPSLKSIFFHAPFFYSNFDNMVKKKDDNSYILPLLLSNNTKLHMFDVHDTGKVITKVLENPDNYVGQDIGSAGDYLTGPEMAAALSKGSGKNIEFQSLSEDDFKKNCPPPIYEEFRDMFHWFTQYGYYGKNIHPWTGKEITGNLLTLEQWAAQSYKGPQ